MENIPHLTPVCCLPVNSLTPGPASSVLHNDLPANLNYSGTTVSSAHLSSASPTIATAVTRVEFRWDYILIFITLKALYGELNFSYFSEYCISKKYPIKSA